MKLIKNLSLFFLLFLSISCSKGLPFNIFEPETFVGFLIGIDPFRYNPPPKSIIKYQGAVSSISEGGSIQLGVLLENNPYGNVKLNISSNVSLLTFNGQLINFFNSVYNKIFASRYMVIKNAYTFFPFTIRN